MWRIRVAVALVALVTAAVTGAAESTRHLVLISIDALRPEFYLDPAYPMPELRGLATRGAQARAAEPVFPSVTYPDHSSIVTGVRPMRHGIAFNQKFEPTGDRGRWYDEAADLKASPLWEWARAAGMRTAAVSWPVTVGANIDFLLPERDYYVRKAPLEMLRAAVTPGFFEMTKVEPDATMFRDVVRWDDFLARTTTALIREAKPNLLLLHLVQADYFQHHSGRNGDEVKPALARLDAHLGDILGAIKSAGIADRTTVIVVGDHGFQDYDRLVLPNQILARAGFRACPKAGPDWRATAHVAGGAAAVFVNPSTNDDARDDGHRIRGVRRRRPRRRRHRSYPRDRRRADGCAIARRHRAGRRRPRAHRNLPGALMAELFDTHAHLHFPEFVDDLDAVIARARDAGVNGMLTIGTDVETSRAAIAIASREPDVWAAVGVHPHEAADATEDVIAEIEKLASAPRVVAVGEIGLDYFRNLSPRDAQTRCFRALLDVARRVEKPALIHCRDAHDDVLATLADGRVADVGGIMHCFSGDAAIARRCLDLGLLISIAGPVTYPNARTLPEVVQLVPRDRLVVETDCPYLPPQPYRGKRNEPAYVAITAARVSELRGEALETLGPAMAQNARRLFRI
jgi:TatD family hydrolase